MASPSTDNRIEILSQYRTITGKTAAEAIPVLNVCVWDLQTALQLTSSLPRMLHDHYHICVLTHRFTFTEYRPSTNYPATIAEQVQQPNVVAIPLQRSDVAIVNPGDSPLYHPQNMGIAAYISELEENLAKKRVELERARLTRRARLYEVEREGELEIRSARCGLVLKTFGCMISGIIFMIFGIFLLALFVSCMCFAGGAR